MFLAFLAGSALLVAVFPNIAGVLRKAVMALVLAAAAYALYRLSGEDVGVAADNLLHMFIAAVEWLAGHFESMYRTFFG